MGTVKPVCVDDGAVPVPPLHTTTVIYLKDVRISDSWEHQKKAFFQGHGDESTSIYTDEEFIFHLLEIHAQFCIEPTCKCEVSDETERPKSKTRSTANVTEQNSITQLLKIKPMALSNDLSPKANVVSTRSTTNLSSTSSSDCGSFADASAENFHHVSSKSTTIGAGVVNFLTLCRPADMVCEKSSMTNTTTRPGPRATARSLLDSETDFTDNILPTLSDDGVTEMGRCFPSMPEYVRNTEQSTGLNLKEVTLELAGQLSHDQATYLTQDIKCEKDDESNLGASDVDNSLHALPEDMVDGEFDGLSEDGKESPCYVSHDQEIDLVTMEIKNEKETESIDDGCQYLEGEKSLQVNRDRLSTGGIKSAHQRMKTARVVLHKLDIRRMHEKCEVCHKVQGSSLQRSLDGKELNYTVKCDNCMKDGTEVTEFTEMTELPEHAVETEADVPRETTYHLACHETGRTCYVVNSKDSENADHQVDDMSSRGKCNTSPHPGEATDKQALQEAYMPFWVQFQTFSRQRCSPGGSVPQQSTTSDAVRMRKYLQDLKRYNSEQYRLKCLGNAERLRKYRKNLSEDQRKMYNEKSKLRMKSLRERRKAEMANMGAQSNDSMKNEIDIRQSELARQKKREYWRALKRAQRKRMSVQAREREREKDRDRKRQIRGSSAEAGTSDDLRRAVRTQRK